MRQIAAHPAARGLKDDAAVMGWPLGLDMVSTHDMLAEGVHFTAHCPPADIGWKLVAVNLSDLAAMGARPEAVLMGAGIGSDRDADWAIGLAEGMAQALRQYDVPLLGGDTIRTGGSTVLSLTALGSVPAGAALARMGAGAGDELWVSGTIGDAGLGLKIALGQAPADPYLLKRYRRPTPRLALGLALRGLATAAMDVSDGLLLDASRLAAASGLGVEIASAQVPLSPQAKGRAINPADLFSMGDDYELLFTAPASNAEAVMLAAQSARTQVSRIGQLKSGQGITLDGEVPGALGYTHK